MSKKSFTIMELLISVVILSMMFLFTFKLYNDTVFSQKSLIKSIDKTISRDMIIQIIYDDIEKSMKLSINNKFDKDLDILNLETSNSIYNRVHSYIKYEVVDDKLYRLESSLPIPKYNNNYDNIDKSVLLYDVKIFKLFGNKTNNKLVYIQTKDNTIYFEVRKIDDKYTHITE